MTASDLFTYAEAKRRRDEGMNLASLAQGKRWHDIAYDAIVRVAQRQITVHVDDILRENIPPPDHPNAYGAVWLRAIRAGIIQRSNQTAPCTVDPAKHAHRYCVYFSRIHNPRSAPWVAS